ncbi:MAG: hypothetical protein KDI23_11165, partial [Pseudomonadales bacterium]|nr:hypothetical protein [Pseudomonadales bacterium]
VMDAYLLAPAEDATPEVPPSQEPDGDAPQARLPAIAGVQRGMRSPGLPETIAQRARGGDRHGAW